jgi:Zn finger protein HypA/HybF involved in hydrogenase expression
MRDFKLPDSYYDPPETLCKFAFCRDCEWFEIQDELPDECPECKSANVELDEDWF